MKMKTLVGAAALSAVSVSFLAGCVSPQMSSASGADSACPVEPDPSITTTARIAYQSIPNGDLVVKDRGWLESCMPNATISWAKYNSGADVVQAFGAASADIGLVGSGPAVKMLSAPLDLDVKVVWIFDVIGEAESLITLGDEQSVDELGGKKIAVPFGSTAHYSLLAALGEAGVDPTEVELINLAPDAMLAAWERQDIDAAWIWDPTLTELKKTGSVLLSSAQTAEAGRPTFDLAGATTAFIETNPEFMNMWTVLQSKAAAELNSDPEAAAESIAVQLGITPEEVATQISGYVYLDAVEQMGEAYFGGGLGDALFSTAEFLKSQDLIDALSAEEVYRGALYVDAIENAAQ